MNYPTQANPDLARFLNNSTHPMEVGSRTLGTGYRHVNAWDEVHDSLSANFLGFFDQETIPNDEFPVVRTYQESFGSPYEFGDANPIPVPVTTVPAASQGVRGTTTAANVASTLNAGFTTLRQDLLDDFAARWNLPSSALPLLSGDLADLLGLSTALTNAIGAIDVGGATTMTALQSQLVAAGFIVNVTLTDAQLAAAAANEPIDFVRRQPHLFAGAAAGSGRARTRMGSVPWATWTAFNSMGNSMFSPTYTSRFHSVSIRADSISCRATAYWRVWRSAAIFWHRFRAVPAAGNATLGFARRSALTSSNSDGRVRLTDLDGVPASATLANHSARTVVGGAGVTLEFSHAFGGSNQVEFGGSWIWDLNSQADGFSLDAASSGIDQEGFINSITEIVAAGIDDVRDKLTGAVRDSLGTNLSFLGEGVADSLAGAWAAISI